MEPVKSAQDKMGKQFDIKKIPRKVLESGVMPICLIRVKLMAVIAEKNMFSPTIKMHEEKT
jgi:uncharacterized protein (DUF885 family)